jgi:nicotinate dehydrogenase subunit B
MRPIMEDRKFEMSDSKDRTLRLSLKRREFMKLLGGGIFVFFTVDDLTILRAQETRGRGYPSDFNAYLRIAEDGKVTVFSGKIEMGQGIVTSLAQEAADELGVALESIEMVMGDTDLCPYDSGTYGSMSTRFFGPALRNAAAEARAVLMELAAEQLKAPEEKLAIENGVVSVLGDKNKRVTFGQLAKGQKITRKLEGKAVTKSVSEFAIMGKPTKRTDGRLKVTGRAKFAGDMREPGMMYARILRPPAHGAKLLSVDISAAEKIPGTTIVNEGGLVAALHADPEMAATALGQIKAKFDAPAAQVDDQTIYDHFLKNSPRLQEREKKGDLAAGEKAALQAFDFTYTTSYGAHSAIETHTALAKIEDGKATVWISTQAPFMNQQQIAQAIGLPPQNVRVITPFVGGGFGGKVPAQQSVEAARLAKISGKPVQVMWSRAEEFFYDTFRPAAVVKIKSGIDNSGKICLWDYNVYMAGARSSEQFYDVPHNIIRVYGGGMGGDTQHPFATGAWRAPGAMINVFAREQQIDIMAAKAKVDPIEFRLTNTSDPRMRKVLETVAAKFGWKKAPAPSGRGLGIACGIDAETYVAEIAEVSVDKPTGSLKVKRIVCAQDMGLVINPEGALMQAEGCIMMALGYTLSEDILFKGGDIQTRSLANYDLPRFSVMPSIEVELVRNNELPPKGGGEPAIVAVGAAVANAIYDATGARLTHFPMTPPRVKKALATV